MIFIGYNYKVKFFLKIGGIDIMSINKSYVLAGALVATSSIIMPMAETSQVEAATQTVTVTSRVNFRKGPSMNYSIMRKLYKGYKLTYLGRSGNWIKVKYNGTTGYIKIMFQDIVLLAIIKE